MRPAARLAAALVLTGSPAFVAAAPGDLGPNASEAYVKECGACHFAYQPGLLPERSWKRLLATLNQHFGESAELKTSQRDDLIRYLAGGASDRAASRRAKDIDASIPQGDVPLRVTQVPYISGVHGGLLDPKRMGRPVVPSLVECSVCHPAAERGNFEQRRYTVSDEAFRSSR